MTGYFLRPYRVFACFASITLAGLMMLASPISWACPFCNPVAQTLRQEMEVMDAIVIASSTQNAATRNLTTGEVTMKIELVLKGDQHVKAGQEVTAIYYGDIALGRRFMLSGVEPQDMQWSCLPLTERGEAYVIKVAELAEADPVERLRFYDDFLQDEESMLARDAYDEFAITSYESVKALKPEMDHDRLVSWISDPDMPTDRKRLYLTMLGVCGTESDLPMLEEMLRSTKKSTRGGLDALIGCYLTLSGEKGLPLVDELFLNNPKAPYADTYAAIMAVRFHGTEADVIPRSALVESLHHVLNRPDLADLVIPDLARWQDWSQIDRLTELFVNADADNNWVRVPVVNYLRACPLDKAKEALEELKKVDPESVKRASTFFSIPTAPKDSAGATDGTALGDLVDDVAAITPSMGAIRVSESSHLGGLQIDGLRSPNRPDEEFYRLGARTAAVEIAAASDLRINGIGGESIKLDSPSNPWRLAFVLLAAIGSLMIAQFLLLTGGTQPAVT